MKKIIISFIYFLSVVFLLLSSLFLDIIIFDDYSKYEFYINNKNILLLIIYILDYLLFVKLSKIINTTYSKVVNEVNLLFIILSFLRFINTTTSLFNLSSDDFQILYFIISIIFIIYKMKTHRNKIA